MIHDTWIHVFIVGAFVYLYHICYGVNVCWLNLYVVCSGGVAREWAGVPRRMYKPGSDSSFRCACIRTTGPPSNDPNSQNHSNRGDLDSPNLREYEGCEPRAMSCSIIPPHWQAMLYHFHTIRFKHFTFPLDQTQMSLLFWLNFTEATNSNLTAIIWYKLYSR